jgi:hypothetical protein
LEDHGNDITRREFSRLERDVRDHEERLRSIEEAKAKLLGMIVAASAFGGVITWVVSQFLTRLFGHAPG